MDEIRYAELKDMLRDGFRQVNGRLDRINGQVGEHESDIAVLRDRSDRAEKQAGVIGAITGGLTTGVVFACKALFGK